MANDSITFSCPACAIKLTVPGHLAGVTGPCPSCSTLIQAPYPVQSPQPVQPNYSPPSDHSTEYAGYPPAQDTGSLTAPVQTPAAVKPEPRQLPQRSLQEPVAKQMPDPNRGAEEPGNSAPTPHRRHPRRNFLRFLIPAFFAIATGAIIFGVLTVLKNDPKKLGDAQKKLESTVRAILPENATPEKKTQETRQNNAPPFPATEPARPNIVEPPPTLPDGIEPVTPGNAAGEVIEKFLAAKSLSERLPMIETHTPTSDLEKSCLSSPLPPAVFVNDGQETNTMERVVDVYFSVDFDLGNGQTNPQTLLVRIRGNGEPKVVVDPFLDMFGGRLAAYAKAPTDKPGVFQVIISAVASCNDERVPNREKKLTLKLLPRDNTKEIARAYFGRQSKIGLMLEDGTYLLSYGKAKACTVVLRWNSEDNPETPYLEALDLKTLDWNP